MKTSWYRLLAGLLLGTLGLAALGGCAQVHLAQVHPWERATLADYKMNPNRDPLAATAAEHVFFSRESASGGRGVGGSGCGCK